MSEVLQTLKAIADTRNYDLNTMVDSTGLSAKTIVQVLSGQQENPKLDTLEAIVKYFGLELLIRTGGEELVEAKGEVAFYRRLLAEKQEALHTKDLWIFRLFVVCLALIALCIIMALLAFSGVGVD